MALLAGGWGWFHSADPDVEKGNRHYQAGEYAQALEAYRDAVERGDEDGIHHNMGAALYKLAEQEKDEAARAELMKEAETELRRGAESDDPTLKSSAYHNLGNIDFQRGDYEAAAQSYKRALRANPNNDDARYNLEMALRKLNKDKPPPQPQQGQGQGQPQQGQGQQQDPQQGQGQGQQQQDPQQGQGQGQQQQDPQQGQGQGQDQKDPQQGQGQDQKDPQQGQDQKDPQQGQGQDQKDQKDQKDPQGQGQGQGQGQDGQDGQEQQKTETERKLDSLEHNSRELRRNKLRNQSGRSPYRRMKPPRDW